MGSFWECEFLVWLATPKCGDVGQCLMLGECSDGETCGVFGVCAAYMACVGLCGCEFLRVSEFFDQTREHQTLGLVCLKLRSFGFLG